MTRFCILLVALLCIGADIAFGGAEPPTLDAVLAAEPAEDGLAGGNGDGYAGEARRSAMRGAGLAFGAQSGLARRGWEIARTLERHADRLSRIYRFRALMLQDGDFTVIPPVLAVTDDAFRLDRNGTRAASARRVMRIVETGRIVSAAPDWRDFLVRQWPEAASPPAILFPQDEQEAVRWRRWLRQGWAQGTALADEIFADDLERLNRAFEGLVLWRRSNLAGMVSAPVLETDRIAASGHGRLVRIDEAVARLGEEARFELNPGQWKVQPEGQVP